MNVFAVRANIGSHVKPWLNTGLNINFTRSLTKFAKSNSYDYSIIRSAMLYLPTLYVGDKTEDDSYAWLSANPRTYVNTAKDELKSINVFTSAFAEIKNPRLFEIPSESRYQLFSKRSCKLLQS